MNGSSDNLQDKQDEAHYCDLESVYNHRNSSTNTGKLWLRYVWTSTRNVVLSGISFFKDPKEFFRMMTYYIVTVTGLLVFKVFLKLATVTRILPFILQIIMHGWGQGLSAVNMANPGMFTYTPSEQFLLLISAVVYERKDGDITAAYKLVKSHIRYPNYCGTDEEVYQDVLDLSKLSLSNIRMLSEGWGMEFETISELNCAGAPFASLWWNDKDKFIVVAFKGTTPWDYTEWITDATYQKKKVESRYFPSVRLKNEKPKIESVKRRMKDQPDVHAGFYDSLFPHTYGDTYEDSPAGRIIQAVQRKVKILKKGEADQIPVWVTGHSLGAGYASLFYASLKTRLANDEHPFGSDAKLMDAYVYGCPAVGDRDFAKQFTNACKECKSSGISSGRFYRVVNDLDPVTRVPFSPFTRLEFSQEAKSDVMRYPKMVEHDSLFDYTVIGNGIKVYSWGKNMQRGYGPWNPPGRIAPAQDPFWAPFHNIFSSVDGVYIRSCIWMRRVSEALLEYNVAKLMVLFIPILSDHFPSEYWLALKQYSLDGELVTEIPDNATAAGPVEAGTIVVHHEGTVSAKDYVGV
ncbi:hypothetical protein YB2330_003934 [Saitoella coloradoensis]